MNISWKALAPVVVAITIALIPAPAGLPLHAWYYFAIFAGSIVGLMLEPIPGAAIGLIARHRWSPCSRSGCSTAPSELAKPGFNPADAALAWALSGFSNSTVWLIFGAFMFALGYEKTGLGRRIALLLVRSMGRRTLTLGYAVAAADTLLAPFTPSNTARSGGTIFPVIRNLPPLYDSKPNDPSARRIGSYVMWTAIADHLRHELDVPHRAGAQPARARTDQEDRQRRPRAGCSGSWLSRRWASCCCSPFRCSPTSSIRREVKQGDEVPAWAASELAEDGAAQRGARSLLAVLVIIALGALDLRRPTSSTPRPRRWW